MLQSFPRHLDQTVCRLAGCRFEIGTGVPMDVDDLAPTVDDDRRRRVARDQQLLDEIGNLGGARGREGEPRPPRGSRLSPSSIRPETVPVEETCLALPSA